MKAQLVAAVCWNIWRERNNRIFNGTSHTIDECIDLTISDIDSWIWILANWGQESIDEGAQEKEAIREWYAREDKERPKPDVAMLFSLLYPNYVIM